jgi:hypothetical protein
MRFVWVFSGEGAQFPAAVFSSQDAAQAWISEHGLTGVLTQYPVDQSALDWAMQEGWFKPKAEKLARAEFVQRFTSASQPHVHFEGGIPLA